MRNNWLPLLGLSPLFLALASATAQLPPPPPVAAAVPTAAGSPKIQFATTAYEFGKVSAGEVVHATFVYTNVGTGVLEVTEVRPTCGCTVAGNWEKKVEPGKTGTIPLQVNTANFSGQVVKMVTVTCNDPSQPSIMLQIKGTIWKPIDVTPTFVIFNVLADEPTNDVRTVRIVNNADTPLSLTEALSANPAFHAVIKTNQPGKEYELQISTAPPFPAGTVQGQVTVKTSSTNMPLVTITAMAMVQPSVVAVPNQLFVPPGPLASDTQLAVTIRNNKSGKIEVSSPSVTETNVAVKIQELEPGRVFTATLTFPAGFLMPAGNVGHLSVKTSSPQIPLVSVPILQMPRPATYAAPPMPRPKPTASSAPAPAPWLNPGVSAPPPPPAVR